MANALLPLLIAGLCLPISTIARAAQAPPPPLDASGDDIFLIQASVSPNVILFLDNSQSMNAIEWHPAFDPEGAPFGCSDFDNNRVYRHDEINYQTVFDGINDYVEVPHDPSYLLDDGTVSLWFNTSDPTQDGTLFSKDSSGFDTGGHLTIRLMVTGQIEVRFQSATQDYFVRTAGAVAADVWHHVAFTFGSGGMELYVDGVLEDTDAYTGGTGATSGGIGNFEPIAIGASTWTSGNGTVIPLVKYFEGSIDETALFDSALSAIDVADLYADGLGKSGIVQYELLKVIFCGNSRKIWVPNDPTYYDGRYLNWYFSDDADPYYAEIQTAVASVQGCTQSGGSGDFADKYRRTRFQATKQVLLDLLCVAEPKNVRFATAAFREVADADLEDPNGGFISEDLNRSNPNHAAQLEASIKNEDVRDTDGTPLSETLFQLYTYWMSRTLANVPVGVDGVTQFPIYEYDQRGDRVASNQWFDDALENDCEKAFVVIVTDGQSSRDDGDQDPIDTALGFANFGNLIGDYYADGEVEVPGDPDEPAYYLDDIAKYMYDHDFRPDLNGDQTVDTYTVGFATDSATDDYLERTATLGNGNFYKVQDGDELTNALIAALNNIIEKSVSFTAATVPAARTEDGADFYQSYFFPRAKNAFWEGHIRAWKIDADGNIEDKNGACALDDPDVGECNSGPFKPGAEFFWDAADQVPASDSRNLYVSNTGVTSGLLPPAFTQANISAADLFVQPFTAAPDHAPNSPLYLVNGSTATTEEGLADEIVAATRGCFFGTGVNANVATPSACANRPARLADVFHSGPVVVRRPHRRSPDASYHAYKTHYDTRKRVLYAGTNGGFLEALHTGSWVVPVPPPPAPPYYDEGTGIELFGFMPWEARSRIRNLPIDEATDRNHYVDGQLNSSDVWIHPTPSTATKAANGSEWRTYLLGGLREGGHHYFALDVTNPDGIAPPGGGGALPYPGYAWEFPNEADAAGDLAFMGESWAQPIITKVRLKDPLDASKVVERWVAIVTAGYDPTSDPNPEIVTGIVSSYDATSTLGRGVYIIDLKTGGVLAEKKFGSLVDNQASMLFSTVGSASVLDLNSDGFADTIYIVSMGGQVYKWSIAHLGEDRINDGSGLRTQPNWPYKLFFEAAPVTIGAETYYKNFMFPPAAAYTSGKLYLAFGSGERRNLPFAGDPDASETGENNRFYVMVDSDPFEMAGPALATITEADLTDFSGSDSAASFNNKGFFFSVADGEKFVTNVEIFSGNVIAASFTPNSNPNPCVAKGDGTLYVFDIATGEGHFEDGSSNPERSLSLGPGLPTDPKISIGVGGKKNKVVVEKSGADIEVIDQDNIDLNGATLFWREND